MHPGSCLWHQDSFTHPVMQYTIMLYMVCASQSQSLTNQKRVECVDLCQEQATCRCQKPGNIALDAISNQNREMGGTNQREVGCC